MPGVRPYVLRGWLAVLLQKLLLCCFAAMLRGDDLTAQPLFPISRLILPRAFPQSAYSGGCHTVCFSLALLGVALAEGIVAAGGCSRLREPYLANNVIGDATVKALGRALAAAQQQGPSGGGGGLTSLDLSGNCIGPAGAWRLAEGLRASPSLALLDLSNNKLGAEGAAAIVAGLAASGGVLPVASRLRTLRVSGNGIGCAGAAAMLRAGLRENAALTELCMDANGIRDEGCLALARWAADRLLLAASPDKTLPRPLSAGAVLSAHVLLLPSLWMLHRRRGGACRGH